MSPLFSNDTMTRTATISRDGLYRYTLERVWGGSATDPWVMFLMLNPSNADADIDDPTIVRCIGFAKRLGYTRLTVRNLFAYRATKPKDLFKAAYPEGPDNDIALSHHTELTICAWGANASERRVNQVLRLLGDRPLWCLGYCSDGITPRHPLMLRNDAELVPYPPRAS